MSKTIEIPLLADGSVALIDAADAVQARWRWTRQTNGYVVRATPTRKAILLHREILGISDAGFYVQADHINRNKLDNRRVNLRIVTIAQNRQNQPARGGTSSYRGVSWAKDRKRWVAYGAIDEHFYRFGSFTDELAAARAAEAFRRVHMTHAVPDLSLDPLPPCPCRDCSPQIPQSPTTCDVDDCKRLAESRGWCAMHYKRWRTHGDPLKIGRSGRPKRQ